MKKLNLNIILFVLFISAFAVLNLVQTNRATVSELENRALKDRPEFTTEGLVSGAYFKEVEEYYADTFVYRDSWVRLARDINVYKGFTDDTGAVLVTVNNNTDDVMIGPELAASPGNEPNDENRPNNQATSSAKNTPSPSSPASSRTPSDAPDPEASSASPEPNDTSEPKPAPTPEAGGQENADAEPRKVGGVLIANGRAMETHYYADSSCRLYAGTLNGFQEKLGGDVKVYSLIAPVAIAFYNVEKFEDITSPQDKTINTVNGYLNGSITPVDAYGAISRHTDEYVYFRTDHHWTALGAYYAYTGFMEAFGEEPVPVEDYETAQVTGFLGSLYQSTLSKILESNPDTITIFKPFTPHEYTVYYEGPVKLNLIDMSHSDKQNKYLVFMSGDRPLGRITTDVKNGRKIVVIKESYGNAFVPFLLPHFEEIYTVDPRQYTKNILDLIEEEGIQNVLFLNYVNATGMINYNALITEMTER